MFNGKSMRGALYWTENGTFNQKKRHILPKKKSMIKIIIPLFFCVWACLHLLPCFGASCKGYVEEIACIPVLCVILCLSNPDATNGTVLVRLSYYHNHMLLTVACCMHQACKE